MKKRSFPFTPQLQDLALLIKELRQMSAGQIWAGILTGIRATYRGVPNARKTLNRTVLSWEGTTKQRHRYGGTEWRLGRRELGHIHANWLVDIPFPKKVRDAVVSAGEAEVHHILPDSGWVSFYLRRPEDIDQAIKLLHRSFELAIAQQARYHAKGRRE